MSEKYPAENAPKNNPINDRDVARELRVLFSQASPNSLGTVDLNKLVSKIASSASQVAVSVLVFYMWWYSF